ncbi:hypothetical protein [Bosea caraganae]|uniref:hypothetical protein n=1 Tax=Bosea caraganae TaxID=2763117 RepID=UPI0015F039C6|nr:hypothetical protein [Bosea caraganae]
MARSALLKLQQEPRWCHNRAEMEAMMVVRQAIIRPSNSLVVISGGGKVDIPVGRAIEPVAASPTCLLVACCPEVDGDTELTIGLSNEVDPGNAPGFVGRLETPRRRIVVETVEEEVIFDQIVPSTQTAVRIWFSHPKWPEKVIIGID